MKLHSKSKIWQGLAKLKEIELNLAQKLGPKSNHKIKRVQNSTQNPCKIQANDLVQNNSP
jgi:hypothetical protein